MSVQPYPRIVFLGTPEFAVASLAALVTNNYNVVAVVTAPDKPAGRGMQLRGSVVKEYALSQNIPVLQPEKLKSTTFLEQLQSYDADLQVVVAFRMLPEVVWNMPPMGTVNVHASLLPQYRGAAPINRAIMNGETQTGVTTFRLKHEIDTGNILLQEKVAILPEDNAGTLYEKLMRQGAALLLDTVAGLRDNTIPEQPQELNAIPRHAPKIYKEDGQIHWEQPVTEVHNLVRGLSPSPAAYTYIAGNQLKIFTSGYEMSDTGVAPGAYETDGKKYLKFAAADGWLYCKEVQYEGKKKMLIEDFLRGFRLN
jgi:methionyl-tRNA formyltransferase